MNKESFSKKNKKRYNKPSIHKKSITFSFREYPVFGELLADPCCYDACQNSRGGWDCCGSGC